MTTTLLPHVLTTYDFPEAELHALALDGDLFRLDQAFCSIAEFDEPWRRATALADQLIVDLGVGLGAPLMTLGGRSAAWVWGALVRPPSAHVLFSSRPFLSRSGLEVRQVAVDETDVVDFGPIRVTSPGRTVLDLARADPWSLADEAAARHLIVTHRLCYDDLLAAVERRGRPFSRRVRERITLLRDEEGPDMLAPPVAPPLEEPGPTAPPLMEPGPAAHAPVAAAQPALTR